MGRSRIQTAAGLVTVGLTLAAVACIGLGAARTSAADATRCARGSVAAVVEGKRVCLRRGQRCRTRLDRVYHRYGFHCHTGRLTGGPGPAPAPPLPAGKVLATIRAPSTGGVAIGAGSVWVANLLPHTLTRIDPATNAVSATISIGDGLLDPFHGPTRVAFGHGTIWVLDGAADCGCVHRVDPATNAIVATINLGTPVRFRVAPFAIAVRPEAVWIALREGIEAASNGSVVRVDPATNSVVGVIGAGSNPDFGGATGLAANASGVWTSVPSMRSVLRIDPATNSVVATTSGLTCGEGQVAADDALGVWIADCDVVRQLDPRTNQFVRRVAIPGATGGGVRGIAIGDGSVWAQAASLVRIDPRRGVPTGRTPLDVSLVWGEYSIAIGFGSVWVRQQDRVVRIRP